jgi:hypothetical protein
MLKKICQTVLIIIFTSASLMAQSGGEPWISLFNGRNLEGWKMVGSKGIAVVRDGAITCNKVINTPIHTFVCSNEEYKDFILELDVKTDSTYNSGILIRSFEAPKNVDTCKIALYGYTIKIDESSRKWTGGIMEHFGGSTLTWLYSLGNDQRARDAYRLAKWNHFRIEAIGSQIKIWINGIPVLNMINNKYKSGHIGFKIHYLGNFPDQEKSYGQFKNIRIITKNPQKYIRQMDIKALEVQ